MVMHFFLFFFSGGGGGGLTRCIMVYVNVVKRAFPLTWPEAMQISCDKRKRLHNKGY